MLSTVHKAAFALACFVCAGHAKRISRTQSPAPRVSGRLEESRQEHVEDAHLKTESLAAFLLSLNPQATFNPSGAAASFPTKNPKIDPHLSVVLDKEQTDVPTFGEEPVLSLREQHLQDRFNLLGPEDVGVRIRGPASSVGLAERMVTDIARGDSPSDEVFIPCSTEGQRYLTMQKSRAMETIEEITGCEIEIEDNPKGDAPYKVHIEGFLYAVEKAEYMVRRVIKGEPIVKTELDCPKESIGRLVGHRAKAIRVLEKQLGCSIQIIVNRKLAAWVPARVVVRGLASQIEHARSEVLRSIRAGDEYYEITEELCPRNLFNLFRGRRDRNIREIQEKTGVVITFNNEGHMTSKDIPVSVRFKGGTSEVEAALEMYRNILARDTSEEVARNIECRKDQVKYLMGVGGVEIGSLTVELCCRNITVTKHEHDDKATITINAFEHNIDAAVEGVKQVLEAPQGEFSVLIPKWLMGKFMGKDGLNKRQVEKMTGCHVALYYIHEEDRRMMKVIVQGPKDKLEDAQEFIEDNIEHLREKWREVIIRVPKDRIGRLIGTRGNKLKDITNRIKFAQIDLYEDHPTKFNDTAVDIATKEKGDEATYLERKDKRCVFVAGLPYQMSWQALSNLFGKAGTVRHANILPQGEFLSSGTGKVEFETQAEAQRAMEKFNGWVLERHPIRVTPWKTGTPGRKDRVAQDDQADQAPQSAEAAQDAQA